MESEVRLIVTDLDGTLLPKDRAIAGSDILALDLLRKQGVLTTIATGRSMFSYEMAGLPNLPLDFLVFSTGAGILDVVQKTIISVENHLPEDVGDLVQGLLELKLDFMIQAPVPNNHHFHYYAADGWSPDFKRRIDLYEPYCRPLDLNAVLEQGSSQAIVIADAISGVGLLPLIRKRFPGFKVVRTTSPIDHESMWIEIFPDVVTKGHGLERLCRHIGIDLSQVWAVGNDYNDLEMLELVGRPFVVDSAPPDLQKMFEVLESKSPISAMMGLL